MNSNKIKVGMVLAAGFGSRLKPLTLTTPKPLIKIRDMALIDYAIDHLYSAGIRKIIVNTHYLADQIHTHLEKYRATDIEIIISHEEELLETGGGILNAMRNITDEPFLVINSDIFLDKGSSTPPLLNLVKTWNPNIMDGLFLLKNFRDISYSYNGDFNLNEAGKLVRSESKNKFIFIGSYIVSPEFFNGYEVQRLPMNEILFKSTEKDYTKYKFYGLELPSKWFDIGTLERLNILEAYLKNKNEY
ncbi:nucleotidyltransferase family protein [Holosporaceae bacterium 'Namur']|nr:nucleotidyltransferase family protein [Holosporaceae bacterium 'Namur']